MFTIKCMEKFKKAVEAAYEHRDTTFEKCIFRLVTFSTWNNAAEVRLCSDFGEHCFYFVVLDVEGRTMMNGGVIFHGFPESGYKQNGSVQIDPSYGWQIHT